MRYDKSKVEQDRLKRLSRKIGNSYYPSGVFIVDGRYVRFHGNSKDYSSFMKHYNNKRIRHFNGELKDGGYYRRINEHWWNIY